MFIDEVNQTTEKKFEFRIGSKCKPLLALHIISARCKESDNNRNGNPQFGGAMPHRVLLCCPLFWDACYAVAVFEGVKGKIKSELPVETDLAQKEEAPQGRHAASTLRVAHAATPE